MIRRNIMHLRPARLIAAGALALAVSGSAALASQPAASAHNATASTPMWLVANAKTHTVTLTVIAGYNNAMGGFNFNGYFKGGMLVTIPIGYKVNVVFSNKSPLPHSVEFVTFAKKDASTYTPAFKGATSPNPTTGIGAGKVQKFTFVANKVGSYAFVCAVPGHEAAGMWDTFAVAKSGKATLKVKK
jgi:uncharacterized cupredoxin-like copper-binding protein